MADRSRAEIDAIAIQRRLRHQGEYITIAEARELLALYGRCYPTKHGLTRKGQNECERIRSRLRGRAIQRRMPSAFEIRVMVYEEGTEEPGLIIPPDRQPVPYQANAENLRKWWARQRPTAIGATA